MFKFSTVKLARMGVVAGLYVVLSLITFPISSGAIQVRLGEALALLPLVFPETAISLFIGCLISNLITGCMALDVALGSTVTLLAGVLTALLGCIKNKPLKIALGGFFPVILNAFLLPLIWWYCYGRLDYLYIIQALLILAGQVGAVYLIGTPIYLFCAKAKDKGIKGF